MVKITVPVTRGREKGTDPLDKDAEYDGNDAADDPCAQDRGNIKFRTDGLQRGDIRKADAHDDRQPGANAPENGNSWSSVASAVRISETWIISVFSASLRPAGVGYQDSRRDDAHHCGHYMLEPQRDQLPWPGNAVPLKYGLRVLFLSVYPSQSPHKNFFALIVF